MNAAQRKAGAVVDTGRGVVTIHDLPAPATPLGAVRIASPGKLEFLPEDPGLDARLTAGGGGGRLRPLRSLLVRILPARAIAACWPALLGLIVAGFAAAPGAPAGSWQPAPLEVLTATAVIVGLALLLPWERLSSRNSARAMLLAIATVCPLQLGALPWRPAAASVMLIPVVLLAVRHGRRDLAEGLGLALLALLLPLLGERYDEMTVAMNLALPALLMAITGITLQVVQERARSAMSRVNELAHTDPLTGLPNRRGWDVELSRAMARAMRDHRSLTVCLADVNDFKIFNDRNGHIAGDALLAGAAAGWRGVLRAVDFISRWGGDEFAFLLPDCAAEHTREILQRLGQVVPYGQVASFGAAQWDGQESAEELLQRADEALYAVKRQRHAVAG